jgi:hypothetical protein
MSGIYVIRLKMCMKAIFTILLSFLFVTLTAAQSFFELSDEFFKEHVENGLVAYEKIDEDNTALPLLVSQIGDYELGDKDESEKKAFYINAYNILVIHGIVANYPVKSPLDIEGFFDKRKYRVAGEMLTLNEIENEKLRKAYNDPRIHFVLVCAALGCPKITNAAFTPANLESKLEEQTIVSLNDENFIRIDNQKGKADISEIFKWYKEDFGGSGNFRNFINEYRDKDIPDSYSIGHYAYDWSLNEKK